jgi:tRNA pseudouridine38-40 synthase
MARYFIELAYNGTGYHGWQVQPEATSVQGVLQEVLSKLFARETSVTGCGRTDTGVHASHFMAHFDYEGKFPINQLPYKLTGLLPKDIAVYNVYSVPEEANTRFDAVSRTYTYRITRVKNPFASDLAWFRRGDLNLELMNQAGELLTRFDDFASFCKSGGSQTTTLCDLTLARWDEKGNDYVFTITANRFLRNMVRAIVGSLVDVGSNNLNLSDVERIVKSKNRSAAGYSVPAHGLYLSHVKYPEGLMKNL